MTGEHAAALDVELRLGVAAQRLDVPGRRVYRADGLGLDWDAVVLATGAAARPSPWPANSGVHVIRTLSGAKALRDELAADAPVVVVGGGFTGAEVAATASALAAGSRWWTRYGHRSGEPWAPAWGNTSPRCTTGTGCGPGSASASSRSPELQET